MNKKTYLGDGLYAEDEGFQFKLTAQRTLAGAWDEVYLDDACVEAFLRFIAQCRNVRIRVERLPVTEEKTDGT